MSKDKVKLVKGAIDDPKATWGYGYALREQSRDQIVGKVLTIIEILGLPEQQEKSTKDLIRQVIDNTFYDGIYLSRERYSKIMQDFFKQKEASRISGEPISVLK